VSDPQERDTAGARCPNCGAQVPPEMGQHSVTPVAGVVTCPSCGASVTLRSAGAQDSAGEASPGQTPTAAAAPPGVEGGQEYFSGQESVGGVMEELKEKEGGPGGA
jgi:predicted RNA-binding Zn-ribbon protein involved in translation (DUF1610 family)